MSNILTKVPYDDMDFVWIADHWDIHLKGLCRHEGELCCFETEEVTGTCTIYELSLVEKLKWLKKKTLFEICVGRHCTYPDKLEGARFYIRSPKWFWSLIFNLYYWKPFKKKGCR